MKCDSVRDTVVFSDFHSVELHQERAVVPTDYQVIFTTAFDFSDSNSHIHDALPTAHTLHTGSIGYTTQWWAASFLTQDECVLAKLSLSSQVDFL